MQFDFMTTQSTQTLKLETVNQIKNKRRKLNLKKKQHKHKHNINAEPYNPSSISFYTHPNPNTPNYYTTQLSAPQVVQSFYDYVNVKHETTQPEKPQEEFVMLDPYIFEKLQIFQDTVHNHYIKFHKVNIEPYSESVFDNITAKYQLYNPHIIEPYHFADDKYRSNTYISEISNNYFYKLFNL